MSITLVLWRPRQEDGRFEASLVIQSDYISGKQTQDGCWEDTFWRKGNTEVTDAFPLLHAKCCLLAYCLESPSS